MTRSKRARRRVWAMLILPWVALAAHAEVESINLLEAAEQSGYFEVYLHALDRTGMASKLEGSGPFTVLAPTDKAFAQMPGDQRDLLFSPGHVSELRKLLRNHIISGRILQDEADVVAYIRRLVGKNSRVHNDVKVVIPRMSAGNGTLYGIDTVLIPDYHTLFQTDSHTSGDPVRDY